MDVDKLVKAIVKARDEAASVGLDRITAPFKETDMILELLKKQQPMEPESFMDGLVKRYSCKVCGKHLVSVGRYRDGYCSKCGQAVKWE